MIAAFLCLANTHFSPIEPVDRPFTLKAASYQDIPWQSDLKAELSTLPTETLAKTVALSQLAVNRHITQPGAVVPSKEVFTVLVGQLILAEADPSLWDNHLLNVNHLSKQIALAEASCNSVEVTRMTIIYGTLLARPYSTYRAPALAILDKHPDDHLLAYCLTIGLQPQAYPAHEVMAQHWLGRLDDLAPGHHRTLHAHAWHSYLRWTKTDDAAEKQRCLALAEEASARLPANSTVRDRLEEMDKLFESTN